MINSFFRKTGTNFSTATAAEAGQKPVCYHFCDWSRTSTSWPLPCINTNAGSSSKNRQLQSQIEGLCVLSTQQCILGPRKYRQGYYIYAEGSASGQKSW